MLLYRPSCLDYFDMFKDLLKVNLERSWGCVRFALKAAISVGSDHWLMFRMAFRLALGVCFTSM